ncbi:MAG: exosortase H [Methylococcales bacterium]
MVLYPQAFEIPAYIKLTILHRTPPMYLLVFASVLILLYAAELLEPVREAVIMPFTALIAQVSAGIVQLFDPAVDASGIVLRNVNNGAAVAILPGCNGVEAMICLTAAIIAFPASLYHKFVGLACGFAAIQTLNIGRVISLFYLLQWNREWFEWAHLYVWQALIILDALIVFLLWVRILPARELAAEAHRGG